MNIEPDQSLSHSYDVRWKVAAKWSVFSSQRKMMLSGWLDVSSITVAPGILFAAHAEKKEKEKVKKIKKGKREVSKKDKDLFEKLALHPLTVT